MTELEDDTAQSVWIKGGFKNSKKMYFCHAYREHSSMLGDSINSQKVYLGRFLSQWEAASEHELPAQPNEVHVSGDMNLDFSSNKWLNAGYSLCSMTRQVQQVCNTHNYSQLVSQPARMMYNTTEVSSIDNVYCN